MMTNEEVALGLSQKYGAPKNKNREIAVYQSCIEMAEWKDSQIAEKDIEIRNIKEHWKTDRQLLIDKSWNFIRSHGNHFYHQTWEEIEKEFRDFMKD